MGTLKLLFLVLMVHLASALFVVEPDSGSSGDKKESCMPAKPEEKTGFSWEIIQECIRQGRLLF